MTVEVGENKNNSAGNTDSKKKSKKVLKKKVIDIKHVARKLIMAWKQASEKQTITWKEIAPIIDSIDYLTTHWKTDDRLKNIEPIAREIVEKINKIHVELNLRVYGMNRLRMITDELLEVLKNSSQTKTNTQQNINNKEDNKTDNDTESQDKLRKLIASLTHLSELLKMEVDENPTEHLPIPNTTHHKHKTKKRSIFYGLFGGSSSSSSSSSQKQSNSNNDNIITSSTSTSTSSSLSNTISNTYNTNSPSSNSDTNINNNTPNQLSSSTSSPTTVNSPLNDYRNNIFNEWQEYTRKFVEPSSLFKVCRCYINASPSGIPERASILGQNWICIANEISVSLWNVLRKREDDLASTLIFITLYKHSSKQIIERAINTIGCQLPEYQVVRLKVALDVLKKSELNKEQLLMIQSDYEDILNSKKAAAAAAAAAASTSTSPTASNKLGIEITKHSSSKKSQTFKKGKKSNSKLNSKDKHDHSDSEEPLSFAEMLAM